MSTSCNKGDRVKYVGASVHIEVDNRFDELANAIEGYSESDLKLHIGPVQELLEEENKGISRTPPFFPWMILFKQQPRWVHASVAYDASASMNELRKWNDQFGEGGSRRQSPFGFGN